MAPAPFKFKRCGTTDGPNTLQICEVWSHGVPQNPIDLYGLEPWVAPKPYKFIKRFGAIDVKTL